MSAAETHPTPLPDAAADRAYAAQSVADAADRYLAEFSSNADRGYNLDADTRQIISGMSNAVSTEMSLASQASREASSILADDTLYPEGRNRLAREAKESAAQKVAEAFADFDTRYTVAEATLYETARPKVHKTETASARMDAQMLLDGALSRDGASLSLVLQRLASRQDAVGALVSSDWLTDYAMARGMQPDSWSPLASFSGTPPLRVPPSRATRNVPPPRALPWPFALCARPRWRRDRSRT